MTEPSDPRLYLAIPAAREIQSGGAGANQVAVEALGRSFEIVERREDADLQICSFGWEAPYSPRRVFIDHGSFADAGFWAYTAPRLRVADTILAASRVCAQVAERIVESAGPRILEVPLPIDTDRFRPSAARTEIRARLHASRGIPVDGPLVLVAAAFVRRKNHHLAVRAFAAIRAEIPTARLVIAGATPDRPTSLAYRESVKAVATALDLDACVHALGPLPQDELADLMAGADLLLHLSTCRLENFGLVVAEAMAAGLPVVASDWGGLRDLVDPGRTGLLAPTYLSDRGPR